MKKVTKRTIIILAAILFIGGSVFAAHKIRSSETEAVKSGEGAVRSAQKLYTCPMHPEVVQEGFGTCPICKMDLVVMKDSRSSGEHNHQHEKSSKRSVVIDSVVVQNMGVRIADVERVPIFRHVKTLGEVIVAEDEISVVNLRFNGWIEKIFVDETGQQVKKGQALFAVYSPDIVSAMEEYLLAVREEGAQSRLAKSTARRLELLGVGSKYLKRIVNKGKAPRSITITAPRAGYVLHKNVVQGARVKAGSDLYRIGDLDRVWVNAEVYEHDAAWIHVGQKAQMELSFQEGKTRDGAVSYVYPTLNQKTRSLRIRLEFENVGLNLRPGMLAKVKIETRRKENAVAVPTEAVLHSGERRIVFVSKGHGKFEPREVVLGLEAENNRTEILKGLSAGEQVVISGQFLLDSESQLQEAAEKLLESRLHAHHG